MRRLQLTLLTLVAAIGCAGADDRDRPAAGEAERSGETGLGEDRFDPFPAGDVFAPLEAAARQARQARRDPAPLAAGAPRVVYWYTIDALRADVPGTELGGQPVMPALAAFAREAVAFEKAYTLAPNTMVATASMFTGLFPPRHGVLPAVVRLWKEGAVYPFDLDPRYYTLAEVLADRGYETRTHLYTVFVTPASGLLQGFEHLELATEVPDRLFVYEHHNGLHAPYRISDQLRDHFAIGPPRHVDPGGTDWYRAELTREQRDELWLAYLAKGRVADHAFAGRMDWLRAEGAWDEALVIVTSDHGEEFLEHGGTAHSAQLYEEVVHVPLWVKFPRGSRYAALHGRSFPHRVRLVDLYPTIAELVAGEGTPYAVDGESLLPILDGEERDPTAREVVLRAAAHVQVGGGEGRSFLLVNDAIVSGTRKAMFGYRLLADQDPAFDFAPGDWFAELYDLAADPEESRNLAAEQESDFLDLMARHRSRARPLTLPGEPAAAPAGEAAPGADGDVVERLRTLGYLD